MNKEFRLKKGIEPQASSETRHITNYEVLENLTARIDDTGIARVELNTNNGILTVTAIDGGDTNLKINADNAIEPVNIAVKVEKIKPPTTIKMDTDKWNIQVNVNSNRPVLNWDEITNLDCRPIQAGVVICTLNNDLKAIEIYGLKTGKTDIIISADNAPSVTISVEVKEKAPDKPIKMDSKSPIELRV